MRPFHILNDENTEIPTTKREFTPLHALGVWAILLLLLALFFLAGCDASATQAITEADSTRVADSTKSPSTQILGAWKSTATRTSDSLWGVAFLATGRFVEAVPTCGSTGDEPMTCWAEYNGGTWIASAGSIAMTIDSEGVDCDTAICWYAKSKPTTNTQAYLLHGDTLEIGELTYRRVKP